MSELIYQPALKENSFQAEYPFKHDTLIDRSESPFSNIGVDEYLEILKGLPAQTAVLGFTNNTVPVLLDLNDPSPGPVLVLGDRKSGKTAFLQMMVRTLMRSQSRFDGRFLVLSQHPDEWEVIAKRGKKSGQCAGLFGTYETEAGEEVIQLAVLAEQRYTGRNIGLPIVLVIDDLQFIEKADFNVQINFEWLCRHGPPMGIWPVVSMNSVQALRLDRWLSYFKTRVLGYMPDSAARRLGAVGEINTGSFSPGRQFAVRQGNYWLQFWIP